MVNMFLYNMVSDHWAVKKLGLCGENTIAHASKRQQTGPETGSLETGLLETGSFETGPLETGSLD